MYLPTNAFKHIQVMFCSTLISLQHLFMFKYQVDKEKYEEKKVSYPYAGFFISPINILMLMYTFCSILSYLCTYIHGIC